MDNGLRLLSIGDACHLISELSWWTTRITHFVSFMCKSQIVHDMNYDKIMRNKETGIRTKGFLIEIVPVSMQDVL